MTDDLRITTDDGVLRMTMHRAESLNAITAEMSDRIAEELEAAGGRDDVRVVLLTGGGDAFSSGADLSGDDAHEDSTSVRSTGRTGSSARSWVLTSRS